MELKSVLVTYPECVQTCPLRGRRSDRQTHVDRKQQMGNLNAVPSKSGVSAAPLADGSSSSSCAFFSPLLPEGSLIAKVHFRTEGDADPSWRCWRWLWAHVRPIAVMYEVSPKVGRGWREVSAR